MYYSFIGDIFGKPKDKPNEFETKDIVYKFESETNGIVYNVQNAQLHSWVKANGI